MSKETKPKSEGCRWKVLWTLLLGFLLFGASNASAYQITLIFDLPQAAINATQVINDQMTPVGQITDGKLVIEYPGTGNPAYFVVTPSGYSYKFEYSEGLNASNCNVSSAGLPAGYISVNPTPAADGGSVTFYDPNYPTTTPEPDPDPADGTYINLNFGGVNDAYQYVYLMNSDEYADDANQFYTTNENPTKWSFTLNEGKAGVTLAAQKGYRITGITCTDSSLKNANLENGGDYYIQDASGASGYSLAPATSPNFSGAWYIDIYNEKVSGATFVVTLEKASDPVNFTLVTTEAVTSALKALPNQPQVAFDSYTVNPGNIELNQNVDIDGDSFTYYYTEGTATPLRIALNPNLEPGSDYQIVVTSTDLEEGADTYTVNYTKGVFGNPIATITLYDGCINGNFVVTAKRIDENVEPEPEPIFGVLPIDETFVTVSGSEYTYNPEVNGKLSIYYEDVTYDVPNPGEYFVPYFYVLENGVWTLISENDMADVPWNGPMFKGVCVYNIKAGEQYKFAPTIDGTFRTEFVESAVQGTPVQFMLGIGDYALSDDPEYLSEVEPGFQYLTVFGENVELGPEDEYGNSPLAFISIYSVDDPTGVAGAESFSNDQIKLWEPFDHRGNFVIDFTQNGILIINGSPSIAKKFYFTTGEAEENNIQLYISGAFNDYISEEFTDEWELSETGEDTGIYTGTFEVPQGQFEFNLRTNEGMVYRFSGEGQAPEGTGDGEEERPGTMLLPIVFANNLYNGSMEMGLGGEENFFWYNGTWNGGSITVTANLNNNTIKIEAQEDVEIDPNAPVRMYVLGGIDILNRDVTPNPSTDQELILNEKTGLYEGMVENWERAYNYNMGPLQVKYAYGKVFYTLQNGVYTFYGAQRTSNSLQPLDYTEEGQTLDFGLVESDAVTTIKAWYVNTTAPEASYDVYVQVSLEDMQASFTWGYPETVPALVAEDFEMTFTEGKTTPETTYVYVSLEGVEDMYKYAGYQFDITLPFGMEVTQAALGTGIVGMNGYEKPISVALQPDMEETTYRVIGFFDPTTATENIAKLTISGVYNEEMVNGEAYDVTIQNTVVFSTPYGEDRKDIEGSVSSVTIYVKKQPATDVTIESCRLLWPSYTSREDADLITYITEGQSVELTVVLTEEDATDVLEWTATVDGQQVDGITVTYGGENDAQGLTAVVATDWETLELGAPITVVIKAQAETEEVYAEYELMVNPIVLGDANDNGKVNVADVVTTANYIANADIPATITQFVEEFDLPNADVNQSNNSMEGSVNGINITDVTAIVNIALGTQTGRNVRRHTGSYVTADRLVAARVSDDNIAVALDGQTAYAALQVEIEMPAGMSVYGVEKGARAAAHELTYGVKANGNVVVVLYSLDNGTFAAGEGSLFTLQVEGGNAEDIRLVNVFASDAQSNGYELEGLYSSEVTGIFGIEAELASGVRYFTVDGVQVTNPEKGQILIRVNGNKAEKMIVK